MFIVFEGLDYTGKTTQIDRLVKSKHYENPVTAREPDGKIRDLILSSDNKVSDKASFFLFLASRAELIDKTIKPALTDKRMVICDRFLPSTIVYQDFIKEDDIIHLHRIFFNNITPDIIFILDADVQNIVHRRNEKIRNNENHYDQDDVEILEMRRQKYLELAKTLPNAFLINANQAEEDVAFDILEVINAQTLGLKYNTIKKLDK